MEDITKVVIGLSPLGLFLLGVTIYLWAKYGFSSGIIIPSAVIISILVSYWMRYWMWEA